MEYLKANGTEIPAQVCGKQIDRDWDGRASRTVTLTMAYAQAAQLFVDGLNWAIVRRGDDAHGTAQEQDCSDYCVAGPITDNRDGTLTVKMGQYTQLEKALQELERLAGLDPAAAEKLAALMPVLARFAQSYEALGAAAKRTIGTLLPELAALLAAAEGAMR